MDPEKREKTKRGLNCAIVQVRQAKVHLRPQTMQLDLVFGRGGKSLVTATPSVGNLV